MIIQAVLIVLVILIISNVIVGVYNTFYSPCVSSDDYFKLAKKIPNDNLNGLHTIESTLKKKTTNFKTYADYQEQSAIGSDDMMLKNKNPEIGDAALYEAVDNILNNTTLKSVESDTSQKDINDFDGTRAAMFETEFEGIHANNIYHQSGRQTSTVSDQIGQTILDGYSDR